MNELVAALRIAATFHDLEQPPRNSDGDTMREAAAELIRLSAIELAARETLKAWDNNGSGSYADYQANKKANEALRAALGAE